MTFTWVGWKRSTYMGVTCRHDNEKSLAYDRIGQVDESAAVVG
jgi:hypothetical protein